MALQQINSILSRLTTTLIGGEALCLTLKRRGGADVILAFPGRSADQAWRFTVVLRLLQMMREAILEDKIVTKRDLYYRDPALFGSQATVDRYTDDIAFTFGMARSTLNVVAALKGLVYGPITFHHHDGTTMTAHCSTEGLLMPEIGDIARMDIAAANWILVIEKEASFRAITACIQRDRGLVDGIILTAKGYPDIASRDMLNLIATPSPKNGFSSKPLLALMDFDPDGFNIYGCYKYRATEVASAPITQALSRMQFIGLSSSHIDLFASGHSAGSVMPLTSRDRTRAVNMLMHSKVSKEEALRLDLQRMLMLDVKAELQHIDGEEEQLLAFLKSNINHAL